MKENSILHRKIIRNSNLLTEANKNNLKGSECEK